MILAKWYFSDESEQEQGPFESAADAAEAEVLYAIIELHGGGTLEQKKRYEYLHRNTRRDVEQFG